MLKRGFEAGFVVALAFACGGGQSLAAPKKKAVKKAEEEPAEDADAAEATEKHENPVKSGSSVLAEALNTKLGLEYNLTATRSDNGFEKAGDVKPKPSTDVALKSMKLKLSGNFNQRAEFKVSLDTTIPNDPIEYAKATAWVAKSFGLSAGKETINQGGFEQKNAGYDTVILSPYNAQYTPLKTSAGVLEVNLKVAGLVTLQITQDRLNVPDTVTAVEARAAQPALTFEWLGDFKLVHPLLQFGSYDAGRSKYFDVGLGLTASSFHAYADVLYDMRSQKYPVLIASTPDEKKKLDSTHRLIALEAALELKKVHELFLRVSNYEVDQPADSTTGQENRGYNTSQGGIALDDDALTVALGFRFGRVEKYFRPFLAVTDQMARFEVPSSPDKTETRSALGLQVGVTGEM